MDNFTKSKLEKTVALNNARAELCVTFSQIDGRDQYIHRRLFEVSRLLNHFLNIFFSAGKLD